MGDPREQLAEDRARMKHRLPDDIAGVSIYVDDAEVRDDPKRAWLYFREKCRIAHVLEDNKRVLKEKYTEAKQCGEKVNATRKAIAYLKQSIEAIRRERAIEGVVNEDDLQKADPEERRKIDAIAQEKEVYKQNFESLRRLKTEIEHVQRMLESVGRSCKRSTTSGTPTSCGGGTTNNLQTRGRRLPRRLLRLPLPKRKKMTTSARSTRRRPSSRRCERSNNGILF